MHASSVINGWLLLPRLSKKYVLLFSFYFIHSFIYRLITLQLYMYSTFNMPIYLLCSSDKVIYRLYFSNKEKKKSK